LVVKCKVLEIVLVQISSMCIL